MAEELKPDLVLMDVNLPGINGLDATRQILVGFRSGRRPAAVDLRGSGVRAEGSRVRRGRVHPEVLVRTRSARVRVGGRDRHRLGERHRAGHRGARAGAERIANEPPAAANPCRPLPAATASGSKPRPSSRTTKDRSPFRCCSPPRTWRCCSAPRAHRSEADATSRRVEAPPVERGAPQVVQLEPPGLRWHQRRRRRAMGTILVGTDTSSAADLAVDEAGRLARERGAELVVLAASGPRATSGPWSTPIAGRSRTSSRTVWCSVSRMSR